MVAAVALVLALCLGDGTGSRGARVLDAFTEPDGPTRTGGLSTDDGFGSRWTRARQPQRCLTQPERPSVRTDGSTALLIDEDGRVHGRWELRRVDGRLFARDLVTC